MINWKLIFLLSLTGVAMAFASVFGLTGRFEPVLWLAIFVAYGFLIIRNTNGKYFLHAFLTSIVNGLWIGIIHASLFPIYIAHNPEMMQQYEKMPQWFSARPAILVFGPIFGAVFGVVSGAIAWGVGKFNEKKSNPQDGGS